MLGKLTVPATQPKVVPKRSAPKRLKKKANFSPRRAPAAYQHLYQRKLMIHAPLCQAYLALALVISLPIQAESLYSVQVTNDLFSSSSKDGHYTNGVELSQIILPSDDHWTRRLAGWLPGWHRADVDAAGYHLAHQIYTPENIGSTELIKGDRPYAGLVIGGVSLYTDARFVARRETSILNFQFGWVGPAAAGKVLQKGVHEIIRNKVPHGWSHQLSNEPIVSLAGKKNWWWQSRFAGLEWEYGPNVSFQLGNLYDYLSTGGALRFGRQLSRSYGIPSVAPNQGEQEGFQLGNDFGWYGFVGVEGRFMAHNLLLDGNTFESSHSVDRRKWVGDLSVGVTLNWNRWGLALTNVWRTREFTTQNQPDQFGSIILSTWL